LRRESRVEPSILVVRSLILLFLERIRSLSVSRSVESGLKGRIWGYFGLFPTIAGRERAKVGKNGRLGGFPGNRIVRGGRM